MKPKQMAASRRTFIKQTAGATLCLMSQPAPGAEAKPIVPLGLTVASCGLRMRPQPASVIRPPFHNALDLLVHCQELGGAGLQVGVGRWTLAFAAQLRQFAEKNGLFLEGQIRLPTDDDDSERFEKELRVAREAGVEIFRTVALGTRRYETFDTAEAFQDFRRRSVQSLRLAEGAARRLGLRIAIENHKDWRVPELLDLLQTLQSEHIGICVDTGNSISLLEDPTEVVKAYAPYAFTTHFKDMAVQEYAEGFLLSEVPLGEGFLDLRTLVSTLQSANPKIRFNLEMITRDPLKIPCLTKKYYASLPDLPASSLASGLRLVREHPAKTLPQISGLTPDQQVKLEEDHNARSFLWARRS